MTMTVSGLLARILEKKENRIIRDPYWDQLNEMERFVQDWSGRLEGEIGVLEGRDEDAERAVRRLKRYAEEIDEIPDEPEAPL
ncbi:MAG: hypothetical protein ACM3YO_06560 [Bacteroidota bacterium]